MGILGRARRRTVRGGWVRCVVDFGKSSSANHVSFINVVAALYFASNLASCGLDVAPQLC